MNSDDEDAKPLSSRISSIQTNKTTEKSNEVSKKRKKKYKKRSLRVRKSKSENEIRGRVFCRKIGRAKYACTECEEKFIRKENAKHHFMDVHLKIQRFKCEYCNEEFRRASKFKLHLKIHGIDESEPLYSCDKCDFRTTRSDLLTCHVTRMHTDGYNFDCHDCGRKFKLKGAIRNHMRVHLDSTHMCDTCGKILTNSMGLYNHRRIKHSGIYKVKCSLCSSKFTGQKGLDKHMRDQHDPNNPYICKECGKQFKLKKYLSYHTRRCHVIDAVKKHVCSFCGKSFLDSNTYRLHVLTHMKIRPYECNVCRETFTQRVTMISHWKKKHPDAEEPPPNVSLTEVFKALERKGILLDQSSTKN